MKIENEKSFKNYANVKMKNKNNYTIQIKMKK